MVQNSALWCCPPSILPLHYISSFRRVVCGPVASVVLENVWKCYRVIVTYLCWLTFPLLEPETLRRRDLIWLMVSEVLVSDWLAPSKTIMVEGCDGAELCSSKRLGSRAPQGKSPVRDIQAPKVDPAVPHLQLGPTSYQHVQLWTLVD